MRLKSMHICDIVVFGALLSILLGTRFLGLSLTHEDGIVEYLSAVFWLAGMLLALGCVFRRDSRRSMVVIVLLLVCVVSLGEEISWGQRILDIKTPTAIAAANKQSELNFHNLRAVSAGSAWQHFFATGEFSIRQFTDPQNLFRLGFLVFFLAFPLAHGTKAGSRLLSRIGYRAPGTSFLLFLWLLIGVTFLTPIGGSGAERHAIQEIREMAFSFYIAMYLLLYRLTPRCSPEVA